jgi:hypothetical protein
LALVVSAIIVPKSWLRWFAFAAIAVAIGFWAIFIGGWRKVGPETQGAPIWWNILRPVHGVLWALIAYFSWNMDREVVWRLLLADVCMGLVSFSLYHSLYSII